MRTHGGNIYKSTKMLDFSANINPLGMPDSVRDAIINSASDCVHYPDPNCTGLVREIADFEQISPAQIVCGNGAADLIYRIAHAFRPRHALIAAPTFSEYAFALHETGCKVSEYPLDPALNFALDQNILSQICNAVDMVILCSPNNPTGQRIQPDILYKIAQKCRKFDVLLICDECFMRFAEDYKLYSLREYLYENCIILHAFTKLFSMPGLRLGYALCGSEPPAQKLRGTGQYWSVSIPAQAAGIAALHEPEWIKKTAVYVAEERRFLTESLRKSGIFVYDSAANFLLLKAPSDFAAQMEQRGIMVRKCADFHGLSDEYFRIAVRTHSENLALTAAAREVYK